jgi:ribonuclease HII
VTPSQYIASQKLKKFLIGIDEVGRGPLAGPVSIGIVIVDATFDLTGAFPGLRDSKKLSAKAREKIATAVEKYKTSGEIRCGVYSVDSVSIDACGIEHAITTAIQNAFNELKPAQYDSHVFLDGRLKAPKGFEQQSLIGGDDLIPAISLASVIAKVSRDAYMSEIAHSMYPQYGFDSHKGYGSASHIRAIREFGPSPFHRNSFLSRILPISK